MKCGFCGNELENGAQFCPNCGMIISLGEENEAAKENDVVVESVYNVFKSNIEKEKKDVPVETAKELAVDPTEEKVEFVMSLPEFEEYAAEPIKAPETTEVETETEATAEIAEEPVAEETETAEEAAEISETEEEPEAEEVTETLQEAEIKEEAEDIYSYSSEEAREEDMAQEAETALDIRVPEVSVIYEGPEKAPAPIAVPKTAPKNEELRKKKQAKESLEKISPDKKENKKAKAAKSDKKGIDGIKIETVLGIAVAVVLVLFACVYAVKNNKIPVLGQLFGNESTTETTLPAEDITSEEDTTESTNESTTQESTEDTTESTTEESTTESTTEATTESTTKETTTKETTTETTTKVTTTKPTTTKPTTTKPVTSASTTRPVTLPSTTKPVATKPVTTTKPNVTEGFGINDVEVKKPVSYLAKSYTAYVTVEGLTLRSKPTTDSYKVLSLSKGADVVVLAKENGFLYIKSNRYGVYGWVSANYVADSRPQSESVVQSGTVAPDKKYATAEIKYTTNGLNVRKGPSTNYAIVGLVPISYPVKVIGYKSDVSGWVYVQDTTYGYTGWVSTAYLK